MPKLPAIQFYTGDWLKDPHLGLCSASTRGIWMDAICAMHENSRSGKLIGTIKQLAQILRTSPQELEAALDELSVTETADVTVSPKNVTLINRRMSREHKLRESNRIRKSRQRSPEPVTEKSRSPSSSSSSSSTSVNKKHKKHVSYRATKGTSCPSEFALTDQHLAWAKTTVPTIKDLPAETQAFLDFHRSKGNVFRDWNAAWRTWMRNSLKMFPKSHESEDYGYGLKGPQDLMI